jgi:ATP-dependent Clp protease ATP-binding subunit ClpC
MYRHFTPRVEQVVKLASAIAREYGQEYVGTEHILLAIEREGTGMGAKLLANCGLTGEKLKDEIDNLVKKSLEDTWVFGRLPGSPHFRNVVATALEEAEKLKADKLHTEHLVLALLKEEGSVAFQALRNLGCDYPKALAALAALNTHPAPRAAGE